MVGKAFPFVDAEIGLVFDTGFVDTKIFLCGFDGAVSYCQET